ncbi:MAG TPA: methyltransferase domain-containing protein [Gammaproteobacteria bacterium]|nr:methyltransferase domain-containing protein [Gammaproteobacteria bacterium]
MTPETSSGLREQLDYYRARATEYDQWWLREGRYDRGAALNAQWFDEAAAVSAALAAFRPAGNVLEIACGTGIWTEKLLPFADRLTALDGSAEMLAMNAQRLQSRRVDYIEADLFQWRPTQRFDTVFFSFWLSHVPPERFAQFWELVRSCLAPSGRVFFIDSCREETSTANDHRLPAPESKQLRRRLNDGREFQIYKIFYAAANLTERLAEAGWHFDIRQTERYFIYGCGQPCDS